MDEDRRQLAITASVFTGAFILVGPLTFGLIYWTVAFLADVAGLGGLFDSQIVRILVGVPAALIAVEVVTEVAALQLYGIGALNRGDRRQRLVRHLVLGVAVVTGVGLLVAYLANLSVQATEPSTLVLVGLAVLALLWGGARTALAFRRGYEGPAGGTEPAGQ